MKNLGLCKIRHYEEQQWSQSNSVTSSSRTVSSQSTNRTVWTARLMGTWDCPWILLLFMLLPIDCSEAPRPTGWQPLEISKSKSSSNSSQTWLISETSWQGTWQLLTNHEGIQKRPKTTCPFLPGISSFYLASINLSVPHPPESLWLQQLFGSKVTQLTLLPPDIM